VKREIEVPAAGEVLNPTWSPDGNSIALSATVGGDSDLFIHNLETGVTRRITSDLFADLQPAWSPDGQHIAFVTDRYTTDAETLHAGQYQLALLDVASGHIAAVPTFPEGKNINPQWAPDSQRLYFVSDQTGVSNVYSVDVRSGALAQITNVDSGVTGITALSPAISSALDAKSVAMSAYEEGSYHIYMIESPQQLAGIPTEVPTLRLQAASLPPVERESAVARSLDDPLTGLPSDTGVVEPYKPRLSLDSVGQPYISAGVDRFGGSIGGGIALSFSDMLGNRKLFTQINADTYGGGVSDLVKNTGALVAYANLTRRLNWGVILEQSPYIAGGYAIGRGVVDGESVLLDQTVIQRQINRGVTGTVAYPFSQNVRVELAGGFTRTSYEQEIRTIATSLQTGQIVVDDTTSTTLAEPMNLGSLSAALVTDTSVFGATSPVAGARSRFEITPTSGDLRPPARSPTIGYYFAPAPFYTIAVRGLHYGRYGSDGEDPRLVPLFIGYPELVRGYGVNSYQYERLVGSRLLVGNIEFRFPLLRPFGVSDHMYGPLPVEVAFFLDSGVTWNTGEKPTFLNGSREPVSSSGLSLRANLFGFAVAQIDYARLFDSPGRGWIWQFSLNPGF
jgi:hypothetical protein